MVLICIRNFRKGNVMRTSLGVMLALRLLGVLLLGWSGLGVAQSLSWQDACRRDLAVLPDFLSQNDAGGRWAERQQGEARLAQALDAAQQKVATVDNEAQCVRLLNDYLYHWRPGHLAVLPVQMKRGEQATPAAPTLEMLSDRTLLLTLPNFAPAQADALANLLDAHFSQLAETPNWIIDVRGNGGGLPQIYQPLLGWLLPRARIDYPGAFLVTQANVAAWARICHQQMADAPCDKAAQHLLTRLGKADRLWLPLGGMGPFSERAMPLQPNRPKQVAVLMDEGCASACEQFLLTARQGMGIKLVGRPSYGAIDYGELLAHPLPSGRLQLLYASARTTRSPDMALDGVGVQPDVLLPKPASRRAETVQVQLWLENGEWRNWSQ